MTFILLALFIALAFEYINGFHDTANAIATSVSTRVLTARQAIALAAVLNLLGAMWGGAVAKTIGKGLVDTTFVTVDSIFYALVAAIIWNLITWWLGLPSSSSHALIGGLCGSTLAAAHGNWNVIHWSVVNSKGQMEGLWHKVVMPMFLSPMMGIVLGFGMMALLTVLLRRLTPRFVGRVFGKLQVVSAALMGFSHGTNDAQKTMGILALILWTGTKSGALDGLPNWLAFLHTPDFEIVTRPQFSWTQK